MTVAAADIAAAAGKSRRLSADAYMITCPAHQPDKTPSCKTWNAVDGGVRFHCFAGCDWKEVRDAAVSLGWLPPFEPGKPERKQDRIERRRKTLEARREREAQEAAEREAKTEYAREVWHKAVDPINTPVEVYLRSRGLNVTHVQHLPPSIRYGHVKEPQTGMHLPAMLTAVAKWPSKTVAGVHCTYLTPQGHKSPVNTPKRMYGACKGGAVRLAPHSDVLALAEGIESGLSYMQLTGTPTWACLSTSGLKSVAIPANVKRIEVAADNDAAGVAAARDLAHRLKLRGHEVVISKPREIGADWNDILQTQKDLRDAG